MTPGSGPSGHGSRPGGRKVPRRAGLLLPLASPPLLAGALVLGIAAHNPGQYRLPDLERFCAQHGLKMTTIEALNEILAGGGKVF